MTARQCIKCRKIISKGTICPYCGKDNFTANDAGKMIAKKTVTHGAARGIVNIIFKLLGF